MFRKKYCSLHGFELRLAVAPIRYGLIRLRPTYRDAKRATFPNARSYVLGGCRVGKQKTREVAYCPKCREVEAEWLLVKPDFDTASAVSVAVQTQRRDLPDSLGKRILKQGEIDSPERLRQFHWIVYRITLEDSVMYHSRDKTYTYIWGTDQKEEFPDALQLAKFLTCEYG